MSSLQTLVESIVSDLIKARFEADIKAAELAELYRENATLRALNVPTLNISNVSIDLKVAFDDTAIEQPKGPSEEQTQAINQAAANLRSRISELESVKSQVTVSRQRTSLLNAIRVYSTRTANNTLSAKPAERIEAVNQQINTLLGKNKVKLSAADQKVVQAELQQFESAVAAAPKAPATTPNVIVGSKALAGVNPDMVSSVKFDVELSQARWAEIDDGTGETRNVLTDR